ncbi:MAG: hypothetical protein Ct9H300mP1_08380 [Planctomycetaceae bacterium]|nr:MAG: hypothetical protein Ct9H300mP1_08380 [Planctomycetaceae bacterium]
MWAADTKFGFELAARQVNAVIKHPPMVGGESLGVVACRDVVAGHRFGIEEQGEHAAHSCDDVIESRIGAAVSSPSNPPGRHFFELRVGVLLAEHFQSGQAAGHGQGISRECSGLVDRAVGEIEFMISARPP